MKSMIHQAEQPSNWGMLRDLERVGGKDAMAYLVEALPQLRQQVSRLGVELMSMKTR